MSGFIKEKMFVLGRKRSGLLFGPELPVVIGRGREESKRVRI